MTTDPTRRQTVLMGAALLLRPRSDQPMGLARNAAAIGAGDPFAGTQPGLIVGGPDTSALEPWARAITAIVGRLLASGQTLHVAHVGGPDGVTAANQFDARATPDGSTALLVSGAPAIAWLTGDPRAQFDATHWLPVATGLRSGIVLTRPGAFSPHATLRLAVPGAGDLALAATLGLSLLGQEASLQTNTPDPVAALLSGRADAIFLCGPTTAQDAKAARAAGATALFSLGLTTDNGALTRDPQFPDVPTLPETLNDRPQIPALQTAWRATAAAAQVEFALLLPWLTPPGTVAWWRRAASQMTQPAPPTTDPTLRLRADPAGSFGLAAMSMDTESSLALRRWLTLRGN